MCVYTYWLVGKHFHIYICMNSDVYIYIHDYVCVGVWGIETVKHAAGMISSLHAFVLSARCFCIVFRALSSCQPWHSGRWMLWCIACMWRGLREPSVSFRENCLFLLCI